MNLNAQVFDSVKVMAYNLLNYGNNTSFCTGANNGITSKNAHLKTIVQHVKPDVLMCNELGLSVTNSSSILNNALNADGITSWERVVCSNSVGSSLVNGFFFNKEKFSFYRQRNVSKDTANSNLVRDIDIISLFYNEPQLAIGADTIFIHFVITHLKAGNTAADEIDRGKMTRALMKFLANNNYQGNVVIGGDFNLYRSTETAYQDLVNFWENPNIRFNDIINPNKTTQIWTNNASFSNFHTQSTTTTSGCFSGGGMDDRFDFILISNDIKNGTKGVTAKLNSYRALGQDGIRFNNSIDVPTNTTQPANVIAALKGLSDHIPVYLELKIERTTLSLKTEKENLKWNYQNPIQENLKIWVENTNNESYEIQAFDLMGKLVWGKKNILAQNNMIQENIANLAPGTYIFLLSNSKGEKGFGRIIKN